MSGERVSRRRWLTGRWHHETWKPRAAGWLARTTHAPANHEADADAQDVPYTVALVPDRCLAVAGMACTTCVERCPEPDAIGWLDHRPVIDPAACTGCGECLARCPAPEQALRRVPRTQEHP